MTMKGGYRRWYKTYHSTNSSRPLRGISSQPRPLLKKHPDVHLWNFEKNKCCIHIITLWSSRYCLKIYQLAYNLLSFYKIYKPKTQIFLIRLYLPMRRHLLCRWGVFNWRNNHLWDSENLHAVKERHFQHKFKVNIWCGVISNFFTGPFELPPSLIGPRHTLVPSHPNLRYLNFPQHNLNELLEDVLLALRENMWFCLTECHHI
ncbi:hypothetical protein NQ318_015216 [Aromia moschata]|uniref:Maturase K n=1 Tax=Aromia moschata TaxID=1265417 RepID=A0AAV8XMK3_9CUCU|nr:hypothetical protein NQ318_015216 [Aromia moschata]